VANYLQEDTITVIINNPKKTFTIAPSRKDEVLITSYKTRRSYGDKEVPSFPNWNIDKLEVYINNVQLHYDFTQEQYWSLFSWGLVVQGTYQAHYTLRITEEMKQ
jgi:hypothetical protein